MERLPLSGSVAGVDVLSAKTASDGYLTADLMNGAARERLSSLAAFAAPLILYACTAQRFVGFWDTGEMDTVPYILGIAHPPGFALYTVAGWAFSHALPVGSVALRMSLFSAAAMALASWSVFAVANELRRSAATSLLGALVFASTPVAWNVGTRADVHALEAALFGVALWMWLRWDRLGDRWTLYAAALCSGLAVAAHPLGWFLLPAALVFVIAHLHELEFELLIHASATALVAGGLWTVYLPLRSAYVTAMRLDPVAVLGMPGTSFWDYGHPVLVANLFDVVLARGVDIAGGLQTVILPVAVAAVAVTVLPFGRNARRAAVLAIAALGPALFAAGFSDESDLVRYLLAPAMVTCALAGVAVASLPPAWRRAVPAVLTACLCAFVLRNLPSHLELAGDRRAVDESDRIIRSTPHDAILVASWPYATTLAYRAYVDRVMGDRIIVAGWYREVAGRLGEWSTSRPLFVVGEPQGSVVGFRLERLSSYPQIYRVERVTANL